MRRASLCGLLPSRPQRRPRPRHMTGWVWSAPSAAPCRHGRRRLDVHPPSARALQARPSTLLNPATVRGSDDPRRAREHRVYSIPNPRRHLRIKHIYSYAVEFFNLWWYCSASRADHMPVCQISWPPRPHQRARLPWKAEWSRRDTAESASASGCSAMDSRRPTPSGPSFPPHPLLRSSDHTFMRYATCTVGIDQCLHNRERHV